MAGSYLLSAFGAFRDGHDFMRFQTFVSNSEMKFGLPLHADIGETHMIMTVPGFITGYCSGVERRAHSKNVISVELGVASSYQLLEIL